MCQQPSRDVPKINCLRRKSERSHERSLKKDVKISSNTSEKFLHVGGQNPTILLINKLLCKNFPWTFPSLQEHLFSEVLPKA